MFVLTPLHIAELLVAFASMTAAVSLFQGRQSCSEPSEHTYILCESTVFLQAK